ncbi:hypothetical protein LBMAG42_47690 [Deltaproteobacteria bacterium]|nr:hypothetical protein LBMAG42_47690 [Deltaproteobacteria bacterium]
MAAPTRAGETDVVLDRYLELIGRLRAAPPEPAAFGATVVRQVATVLRVARVGWWRMRHHPEAGLALEAGWWDGQAQPLGTESFLPRHTFPRYFEALDLGLPIRAVDATTDPRTNEFLDIYLKPKGIGAMLDAPVLRGGVVTGVVCVEHVGGARDWADDETQFLNSLAGLLAQRDAERESESTFERLKESEQRFRELFDSSPDLLQSSDPGGRLQYVNHTWRRTLGYSDPEVERLTVWGLVLPEQRTRLQDLYTQVFAGRTLPNVRFDFLARDGHRVPVEGGFVPVLRGMRVVGCHAFLRAVAPTVEAPVASASDCSVLWLCLDSLPEALLVVDGSFELRFVNQAANRLLGVQAGSHNLRDVADPLSFQRIAAAATAGGSRELAACRLRHADGSYPPADVALSSTLAAEGGRLTTVRFTGARTPSP